MLTQKQSVLIRRYFHYNRICRLMRQYDAPKGIIKKPLARLGYLKRRMRKAGLLDSYPIYEPILEQERIKHEAELERRETCLHHAEHFVAQDKAGKYDPNNHCPKKCPACVGCPHWKPLSEADAERLQWYP